MKNGNIKILLVPNTLFFPPYLDELAEREVFTDVPTSWVHNIEGDVEYLDQRLRTKPPLWRLKVYKRLPMWVVQVLEAYRVGRHYDVVFLWSVANVALVLGLLLKLTRRKMTIVVLLTRISEAKKSRLLQLVQGQFTKIILPPVTQRQFATQRLGIPEGRLVALPWTTDTQFWRTGSTWRERTMICAAGGEMRDYATLVKALDGLDIPCHIAGALDSKRPDWWNASESEREKEAKIPPNITFGTLTAAELRELYEQSRLVVVPLQPTNSDNGITCMNEAWSMGLPVIVSRVEGQHGAFDEGVEGLWVPQGDVEALRAAILLLWNDPDKAKCMGISGRRFVEQRKDHRVFSDGLNHVFAEAAGRGG